MHGLSSVLAQEPSLGTILSKKPSKSLHACCTLAPCLVQGLLRVQGQLAPLVLRWSGPLPAPSTADEFAVSRHLTALTEHQLVCLHRLY
jgi:hypothetical protein